MLDSTKERQYDERLTAALAAEPDLVEDDRAALNEMLKAIRQSVKWGWERSGREYCIRRAWAIRKRLIAAGE